MQDFFQGRCFTIECRASPDKVAELGWGGGGGGGTGTLTLDTFSFLKTKLCQFSIHGVGVSSHMTDLSDKQASKKPTLTTTKNNKQAVFIRLTRTETDRIKSKPF